jgi:LysM repeat protein
MGYWGWRPLVMLVFISVWITGCSINNQTAATIPPTQYPLVTLTVLLRASPTASATPLPSTTPTKSPPITPYASPTPMAYTVQPGDTLLTIALYFGIDVAVLQAANGDIEPLNLRSGQTLLIPNPRNDMDGHPILITATPSPLLALPPTCYPTTTNNTLCLGQITNTLNYPVERVSMNIQLLNPNGNLIEEHSVGVDQGIIPPGASAPYRALFTTPYDEKFSAVSWLRSADAALRIKERFVELQITEQAGALKQGRYQLSATLYNADTQPAQRPRVVLTLYDQAGHVAGYRVFESATPLNPGDHLPVDIEVMPQGNADQFTHRLYVEARRASG